METDSYIYQLTFFSLQMYFAKSIIDNLYWWANNSIVNSLLFTRTLFSPCENKVVYSTLPSPSWQSILMDQSQYFAKVHHNLYWPYSFLIVVSWPTPKHDVYRTIPFNRSCNVLKVNPSGKNSIWCQTYAKTEDHIELKLYFSTRHPLPPFLGTTENATFVHFMKKSMHFC